MKKKLISVGLTLVALCLSALAQADGAPKATSRATIEGVVVKEPGSEPVKKALIELIGENQGEAGNYSATTGPDGTFHIDGILPGRYHLYAERTGLLDFDKRHARSEGRILTLAGGQELKDLQIRLQAAAVIHGRVTDEDGDPLPNADVAVLRETYSSGRRRWEQAGGERTNDLGEFRVAGLAAGNYYVSVSPPPDFKSLIENAGAAKPADSNTNTASSDKSAGITYQTTYYPGTPDRSQAAPVQLRAGDEFPVNFSLTPSPSLAIRGSVVNLPSRTSAVIMLQSRDFNLILNGADIRKDGSFTIRDVSPGSYTIVASVDGGPRPMSARQALQVAGNVDGLRLAPQPGATIRGHLRLEANGNSSRFDLTQIFLTLHSTDAGDDGGTFTLGDQFTNLSHVAPDGSFEWKDVPAGNYSVRLVGENEANADWFIQSTLAGGRDVNDTGVNVSGGALALDVVINTNGGVADGIAIDAKNKPVANAVIVAVPEARLRSRVDRYHKTISDQGGHFTLRGLPPGDYTLFAWESVEGEEYYNPDFLKSFEGQGSSLHVSEGERKGVQLAVIPDVAEP
jgi:protocatechuate 3,4-dioxygenase beta subunit